MTMHWLKHTALALILGATPLLTAAETRYPFSEHGVVEDRSSDVIVISDVTYHLNNDTTITTLDGKPADAGDLMRGSKLGFNMYGTRAQRYISDIWILPSNFNFDVLADE